MRSRRLVKSLSLVVVIAFAVTAAWAATVQAKNSIRPAQTESILRVGALDEPDSVNPFVGVLAASYTVWDHIYELPIAIGVDVNPAPSLVQSWEVSPDKLTWTWHLVRNATWHDGVAFTAEDINFTYRYIWPATAGNPIGCDLTLVQAYLGVPGSDPPIGIDIDNITVIDAYTIEIPTHQPKATILSMFIFIIPKHVWQGISCGDASTIQNVPPIGTGMYKFVTWQRGTYIQLELNQDYWRLDPSVDYVDQVVISYFEDPTSLYNAFQSGSIDATGALSAAQFNQMPLSVAGGANNVRKYAVEGIGYSEMGACVASDALIAAHGRTGGRHWLVTNLTVRQAVQIATNRTALTENIKEGLATSGSTAIPPATPFWHYTVTPQEEYAFNLDRARDLLNDPAGDGLTLAAGATEPGNAGGNLDPAAPNNQDAFMDLDADGIRDVVDPGLVVAGDEWGSSAPNRPSLSTDGGGLSFDISIINTDTEGRDAVENYMLGWWTQIGIEGTPVLVPTTRQITVTYNCVASFYVWGWGGDVDPDFLLSVLTTDQILYWQDAWYSNSTYDGLYALQQTQLDLQERQATIYEMQRIVYHDAPYLILYYDKALTVVRTDLFTGWGDDWESNLGLGLTGYGNVFLLLQLRAGQGPPATGIGPLVLAGVGVVILLAVIGIAAWAIIRQRRKKERIEPPLPPTPKPP